MIRASCVVAGLGVTIVVGSLILDARYDSGAAPAPFLGTAYALGVVAWYFLALVRVPLRPEVVLVTALAFGGAWIAIDAEFRWVFWFVAVPAAGALAASLPSGRAWVRGGA